MGIGRDASSKRPTKQRLKEWSYRLCAAAGLLALFRRLNRRRVAIVVYHVVRPVPTGNDALEVAHRDFEQQIQGLAKHYTVTGLTEGLRALDARAAKPVAVITFDDGYRTTIQRVIPVLQAHSASATVFVPTGLLGAARPQWHDRIRRTIGERQRGEIRVTLRGVTRVAEIPEREDRRAAFTYRLTEWLKTLDDETREEALRQIETRGPADHEPDRDEVLMDWSDVSDALAAGLEIGSHTITHAILPTESPARATWEIEESKRVLEARLGRPVTAFCYPNGGESPEIREIVRRAGYACAATVQPGLTRRADDRYALKRFSMNTHEGPYTLLAKVSGFEGALKRIAMPLLWLGRFLAAPASSDPWSRVVGSPAPSRRRRPRKKIGLMHVVHTMEVGGMERLVVDLIEGFSSDRYDRYVCCLAQRGALADQLERIGVPVYCLDKGAGVRWGLPWRVRALIHRLGISIVHTHNLAGLLYGGVGAALGRAKVLVHTEHGRDLDFYRSPTLQRLEWALTSLPNCVVAVSQPLFDELRYAQRIPLSRLLMIGNGVRVERCRVTPPRDLGARLGIGERDRLVGIIARLVPVKDHVTMLRAMRTVIRTMPEARLLVVGGGPLRPELESEAARLDIAPRVTFLGVRHDIPELLNLLDVFALSSLSEGMSMTILEAMAAKRPVAATDVGGNSWLVHHEKTGLLVPSRDPDRLAQAILRLLSDRALAAHFGEAGHRLVRERFQLSDVVRQYDTLYQHLLSA